MSADRQPCPGPAALPADPAKLDQAIAAAGAWLLQEAEAGFPETAHEMRFPRWAGFLGLHETQRADLFPRAILANLLLDCAEQLAADDGLANAFRQVARQEADYLAGARLTDRLGGWSYFPDLPELPPDLDSLSTLITLFSRSAPHHLALCEEPLQLALEGVGQDGAVGTWLISPQDDPKIRKRMQQGVARYWGDEVDPDVCANFYTALWCHDPEGYAGLIRRGADYLLSRQQADGGWPAAWYWGRAYPVVLVTGLLRQLDGYDDAQDRATRLLRTSQWFDGGWGEDEGRPLDTALALWVLTGPAGDSHGDAIRRGVDWLLDRQNRRGGWRPSVWIRMDTGRASGRDGAILSYQSATLSTAFALRGLLAARRRYRQDD